MSKIIKEIKMTFEPIFLMASIICMLLLFGAGEAYVDNEMKSHSIIEVILFGCGSNRSRDISSLVIFEKAFSGWIFVFTPLILCFGFIYSFHSERETHYIRNILIRENNIPYSLLKAFSCALYSGTICFLSYAVFAIICLLFLPSINEFVDNGSISAMYGSTGSFFIFRLIGAFFYGMFNGAVTFIIMSLFNDKYIIMTFPVMINYIYDIVISKLVLKAFENHDSHQMEIINTVNMHSLFTIRNNATWVYTVMIIIVLYLFGIIMMICNLRLRRDSGDYA